MHNDAHYRPTNNLHISELGDRLTDVIRHQIIEIVFQYYKGTIMEEGELNVPILFCLERFLKIHTANYKATPAIHHSSATNSQEIN